MKKVYWFANPYSPHVRHWYEILEHVDGLDVELVHIHHKRRVCEIKTCKLKASTPLPSFLGFLPELIQYFLLGIFFRFTNKDNCLVHAHNTSGYGLSALLSGSDYGITTYGSEIYQCVKRGIIYKALINKILSKSLFITSASQLMTESLKSLFSFDNSKIFEFSLGISDTFKFSDAIRCEQRKKLGLQSTDKLFVINRRTAPLYQTAEIVSTFLECYKCFENYKLLILAGDSEGNYLANIKGATANTTQVTYVEGFIDQISLSNLLCASDFFISTPKTDQLSSSILEGIICKSVPILTDLIAYKPIATSALLISTSNFESDLKQVFEFIKEQSNDDYSTLVSKGAFLIGDYKIKSVANIYRGIISESS
jgi:hypothetical protein